MAYPQASRKRQPHTVCVHGPSLGHVHTRKAASTPQPSMQEKPRAEGAGRDEGRTECKRCVDVMHAVHHC